VVVGRKILRLEALRWALERGYHCRVQVNGLAAEEPVGRSGGKAYGSHTPKSTYMFMGCPDVMQATVASYSAWNSVNYNEPLHTEGVLRVHPPSKTIEASESGGRR